MGGFNSIGLWRLLGWRKAAVTMADTVPLPFAQPASSMNLMFAIRLVWKFTEKTSLLAIYRGQLAMFYDKKDSTLSALSETANYGK